jgi:hypothetical protein
VLLAVRERCLSQGFNLLAVHVRSTHAHVAVEAEIKPERVMSDLKAFASKKLNEAGMDEMGRKRCARHGSRRWLWKMADVLAAIGCVVNGKGEPTAVWEASPRS